MAAGYSVVTTASPKNFGYVKSLGAAGAFDYSSKDVVRDMIASLRGKDVMGAFAIGAGSAELCPRHPFPLPGQKVRRQL
ncbi:MAG: hypothetical protein WDO73_14280 [Ignavibacteriota bacterium]